MDNQKVSVIVPIYNVEKYLDKCIKSIVNQTYKNLDIILVDDGSPDNCPEMCDEWAEKDERIRVVHKKNGGLSSARNAGLDIMQGNYILFVDSDDWMDDDTVQILKDAIDKNNADISVVGLVMEYDDKEKNFEVVPENKIYEGKEVFENYILDVIRPEMWAKLYTREIFENCRFDETVRYAEDLPMNYIMMKKAHKAVTLSQCKWHYYQGNKGAITAPYINEKRILSYNITKKFVENETDEQIRQMCLWRHARYTFGIISRLISSGDKELINKYYPVLVKEILVYKKEILSNNRLSKKYKIAVKILNISPSLYLIISRIKNRG